jgi:DedD protein
MAERSNATPKKSQDTAQDMSTLQKRGRRRLVGAIALVLLAVIVLPMVFDPEPKPNTPAVSIRIPNEEGTPFTPKSAPKPIAPPEVGKAEKPVEPAPPAKPDSSAAVVEPAKPPEKVAVAPPPPKPVEKPAAPPAKAAEKKPAPAAPPVAAAPATSAREQLVVQVGAFSSPDKVKEIAAQLKEAKLVYYTESVATAKGPVTRVRLGPFNSREAAEKARDRAKALGMSPANPIAK